MIRRIRFVSETDQGDRVLRRFDHPRSAVAIETEPASEASSDSELQVLCIRGGKDTADENWFTRGTDAPAVLTAEREGVRIDWLPGRAIVRAQGSNEKEALAALADFAFYESELRTLEQAVAAYEPQAEHDVALAYRVAETSRGEWKRLGDTMESLGGIRLKLARLWPCCENSSANLPVEGRRLFARLARRAALVIRLEALDTRLEALEDLYEGATDRIADYRWYRGGHRLEMTIILLLLLEAAFMSAELVLHLTRGPE
jgi:hypothetical protein